MERRLLWSWVVDSSRPCPGTVLIVADDDDDMRSAVAEALRIEGYLVSEAHDGAELIAMIDEGSVKPDIIVADIKMPRLSGFGVLQALSSTQAVRPRRPADGRVQRQTCDRCPACEPRRPSLDRPRTDRGRSRHWLRRGGVDARYALTYECARGPPVARPVLSEAAWTPPRTKITICG